MVTTSLPGPARSPGRPDRHARPAGGAGYSAVIITICVLTSAAGLAWLYLLFLHGGYWQTGHRLPPASASGPADGLPAITAIIPARNEASMLPACLPSVLSQDYQGRLGVVLVDDDSSDGTAKVAAAIGEEAGWRVTGIAAADGAAQDSAAQDRAAQESAAQDDAATAPVRLGNRELAIISARQCPPGWAGKVWAMSEGVRACAGAEYLLFTDADIGYLPGTLTPLARAAAGGRFAIVSQMALLRTANQWERLLIPAFVYFFAQLYPFRRVGVPRSRTAAAAGGCMLVRADDLAAAGGLAAIRGARIDDVALGGLLKRAGGRCWLGLSTGVISLRPYDRLADIWAMVARSAYTQLRYSLAVTAGAVAGLAWLYLLPPVAAVTGLAILLAGNGGPAVTWLTIAGLAGWLIMSSTYWPILRLYRLSAGRAPWLPLIAAMYMTMTADSARRHYAGRGGEWKGRVIASED